MAVNSHNQVHNHSINWIVNQSFDTDNQMLFVEPVGINGSGQLERLLTSSGRLQVDVISGGGTGGTASTDEATYTPTSSSGTPIMAARDDASVDTLAEDKMGIMRSTQYRALHVNLRDASGNEVSVGGGTQYTEDVAAASDPTGTIAMAVRADSLSAVTSTDGDNIAQRATNKGELYVKHADTIAVTQSGTWDEVGINDSGNSITVDNPQLSVVGTGTEATALRVTIASDSTGVLSVDDNGSSLTVDGTVAVSGTVAVTQSGTWDEVGINDSGNSITVDNGGTFAVQNTNQTGDNTIGRVKLTDGTDVADILDLTNSNPLTVAVVDGSGTQLTSFGGGTQYTEGDTDTTITGTAMLWEDGGDILTTVSPSTPLPTEIITSSSLPVISDIPHDDPDDGNPFKIGGYAKATAPTAVSADGDRVNAWFDLNGRQAIFDGGGSLTVDGTVAATQSGSWSVTDYPQQWNGSSFESITGDGTKGIKVQIMDGSGTQITTFGGGSQYTEGDTDTTITGTAIMFESNVSTHALSVVNSDTKLPVDVGSISVASVAPGTGPSNLGKAEDVAFADGDVGVMSLSVRKDTAAATSGTDGDYQPLITDSTGRLHVNVGNTVTVGSHAVTNAGTFAVQVDGAALTSLQLIDDTIATTASAITSKGVAVSGTDGTNARVLKTDTSGELQVDVLTMPTVAVTQSGTWDEVGINDSGNSITVDNAGTFAVQVDGNALTSLQLIDDVVFTDDVAFTPATSKVAMIGAEVDDTGTDSVDEGDAGAVRMSANRNLYVRIRDNAGNERGLNIDANGALAATVTNATAANLNMTEASAAAIKTAVETIDNFISGSKGLVTEDNSGAIKTSVELIDDTVFTDDTSTHATGTTKGLGIMAAATPTDASVNANDIGMVAMTTDRKLHVSVQDALPAGTNAIGKLAANSGVDIGDVTLTAGTAAIGTLLPPDIDVTTHTNYARKYYTNAGAVTDGIVWSPAAGKRWHVLFLYIQVSAAATVTLEDDKAGGDDPVWKGELAANAGIAIPFPEKYPMASGEDAADLLITTSAGNVYVTVVGYEI